MSKVPESVTSVLVIARADIGVMESPRGSNRGPRVNKMLANVGLGPGYAWCDAAANTWGWEALGNKWPMPMTADCDVTLAFARKRKILSSTPQPGDIFLLLRASDRDDAYHTGIVTAVPGDGTVKTIEGNTNEAGSSEGVGVFAKIRPINSNIVFAHWQALLTADTDGAWTVTVGAAKQPMEVVAGVGYTALRPFLTAVRGIENTAKRLGWDASVNAPTWDGEPLPFACRMVEGAAWCPVRAATLWLGATLNIDSGTKTAAVVGLKGT